MIETNDEEFSKIALKRVNFRRSIYYYLAFNLFIWAVWWFTAGRVTGFTGHPWPVWLMLGWGIALVKQYFQAYHGSKKQ